jgi:hypothetical protein
MISCSRARDLIVEHVRAEVGEAALLQLDLHLFACEPCRLERARWSAIGVLGESEPPQLSAAARARILQRLQEGNPPEHSTLPVPKLRSPILPLWLGFAFAAALAIAWKLTHPVPLPADLTAAPPPVPPIAVNTAPAPIAAPAPVAPALLALPALEPKPIPLEKGELELRAPTRVKTPRFVFALRQGHAVFAADQARVLEGEVLVYTLENRLIATVGAGQSWSPERDRTAAPAKIAAAALLDRARAKLAAGEVAQARKLVARALDASPTARERAQAELFLADAFLVEADADGAVAAYRRVADGWPSLPEGDSAAFAVAQVLLERGRDPEAVAALCGYLSHHPDGRFAREARERLDTLSHNK